MPRKFPSEREIDAVVDVMGSIVAWRCSACRWSKLAGAGGSTIGQIKLEFEEHHCTEHPKRPQAMNKRLGKALFGKLAR